MAQTYIRLYLLPINGDQRIVDIPENDLVLSDGQFVPPQIAQTITLIGQPIDATFTPFDASQMSQHLSMAQTQEIKVCWREPSDVQDYPDSDVVEAVDPSGGQCVCGITCSGTNLSYVKVYNVALTV